MLVIMLYFVGRVVLFTIRKVKFADPGKINYT